MKTIILALILAIPVWLKADSNGTIKDYDAVCGDRLGVVCDTVAEKIKDGWQPYGGISVSLITHDAVGHYYYCQSIVKYKKRIL